MNKNIYSTEKEAEIWWEKGLSLEENGNFDGAEQAYLKAAKLGHSMAQLNLGNILDDHKSPPDRLGAVYWYIEAWKQGEASAAWNLYIHYNNLDSIEDAEIWRKRAADLGHPDALAR